MKYLLCKIRIERKNKRITLPKSTKQLLPRRYTVFNALNIGPHHPHAGIRDTPPIIPGLRISIRRYLKTEYNWRLWLDQ